MEIIGKSLAEVQGVDFGSSFPVVDPETLLVTGIVDGNYPETLNGGRWITGAVVDGAIVTGEHYSDCAVVEED